MAGHSHWAGIKHKKGRADKLRSNLFSKLSREITVAAKLGDKNPEMNSRLRSAIQAARSANMPKDNIERAIDKSSINANSNFENIRYEGFGPDKVAVIIETLTDNKNRTASGIRTIFQKHGGNLGTQGSASHNFNQVGVIKIDKKEISDDKIFELAIDSGAEECISNDDFHEIQCEKGEIYNVKKKIEKEIKNFISTEIEWKPLNNIEVSKEKIENKDQTKDIKSKTKKSTYSKKKKIKKNITNGIAYVQSTFNNTIVSIADTEGNVISWSSAGQKGFKGSRKSTPYAAQVAADSAAAKALEYGMKVLSVEVKGPGSGRETALRALQSRGFKIISIKDTTPMPHNGTRPPKKRRV